MQLQELRLIAKRSLLRALGALAAIAILAALCAAYAHYVEPTWLHVRQLALSTAPTVRVLHISDIHCPLILAGHTHGGQVILPFKHHLGISLISSKYDRGLFTTPTGPLYVSPGIGTYYLRIRFLCRPELTLISI